MRVLYLSTVAKGVEVSDDLGQPWGVFKTKALARDFAEAQVARKRVSKVVDLEEEA